MLTQPRKPLVIANMRSLDLIYGNLLKHKKRLEKEMALSETPPLNDLRRFDLDYTSFYIDKIEDFLMRYGFMEPRRLK